MAQALPTVDGQRGDRRSSPRRAIDHGSTLRTDDRRPIDVIVRDLSGDGLCIDTDHPLALGNTVSIGLVGIGSVAARVVRRTPSGYGCELLRPLARDVAQAAFQASPVVAGAFPSFLLPAAADGEPLSWPLTFRVGLILAAAMLGWAGIVAAMV